MEKLISIIVPVYNVEKYIDKCIESLVNQTFKELEIILIDDNSSDTSYKKCCKWQKKYKNIRVIHKKNEGLGFTRNVGIEEAKGKYLIFIDSDDFVNKSFCEELYNTYIQNKLDMCISNLKSYNVDNQIIEHNNFPFSRDIVNNEKYLQCFMHVFNKQEWKKEFVGMSACHTIYNKEIIDKYNLRFKSEREYISEDFIFNLEYLQVINRIGYANNAIYYYRENLDSLTRKYDKNKMEKVICFYEKVKSILSDYNISFKEYEMGLSNIFMDYVRTCLKQEIKLNKDSYKIKKERIVKFLNNINIQEISHVKCTDKILKDFVKLLVRFKQSYLIIFIYKYLK